MESILLAARLVLVAVLVAAGIGKLLDFSGSRRALADFGVPAPLTAPGAVALPLAELAIAAALLLKFSAQWGAIAAGSLLLAFMIGIANALVHDRTPDCHCFGQIHSAPAGTGTLVRNGVLFVLALIVFWRGPGPAIDAWVANRTAIELIVGGTVVAGAALVAVVLRSWLERRARQHEQARAAAMRQRAGVPVGSPAPRFELPGACAEGRSLASLCARGHPVVLVFADARCCPCQQLFPHIGRWQATLARQLTIVVVSNGAPSANRSLCEQYAIADVLLQNDSELLDAYRIPGTPSAVVVARDGTIATATATGYHMIEALIRLTLRRSAAKAEPWELSTQPA